MKQSKGFTLYGSHVNKLAKPSFHGMTTLNKSNTERGFTLIELLIVISIIAFLSSIVFATMTTTRKKARDSQRIQNARQIATALELYEQTNNSYKVAGAGLTANEGTGYVAKSGGGGYSTSILQALKNQGYLKTANLIDPIYGTDNYYIGLCTSTNAYNVFVKLEQAEYSQATSSIANTCGGQEAANLGFSYIGATTGGTSGGIAGTSGSYEAGMGGGGGSSDISFNGLTYKEVVAEDGRIWLDRNLGATKLATSHYDYESYGSKYQWGRGTDGHQLINYASDSAGSGLYGSTFTKSASSSPGNNLFIKVTLNPYDWMNTPADNLWQGVSGINNPCPSGFRLPTSSEWQNWATEAGFTTASCGSTFNCQIAAYGNSLKLTAAGYRDGSNATVYDLPWSGRYWSSDVVGGNAILLHYQMNMVTPISQSFRSHGASIRCIKN